MAVSVRIESGDLVVRVSGWDAVWAFSRGFRVPLTQVREAVVRPRKGAGQRKVLRTLGTAVPGVVQAGRYAWRGWSEFWAARWPDRVLVVNCAKGAKFDRIVLQVTDPEADAARIEAALLT